MADESTIKTSYIPQSWDDNVIISDTRMKTIEKGIVNLYTAIFGINEEVQDVEPIFDKIDDLWNNIGEKNDGESSIFNEIHSLKDTLGNKTDTEDKETAFGRIKKLENDLGTKGNNTAFDEINNLKNDLGTKGNNNKVFNEIESAKGRITTLETNLGPAAQDAQNKNTAFDRIATLETNLETLTTNIQPDLKIIENSNIISIDDAAPLDVEGVVVNIEPVQAGSGDPSPENVRPITGWTWAKVSRTGKNLCPVYTMRTSHMGIDYTVTTEGIKVHGTATSSSYSWTDSISTYEATWLKVPAGTYTFSVTDMFGTGQLDGYVVFIGFNIDGTSIPNFVLHSGNSSITRTYTKPVGLYYGIYVKQGLTVDTVVKIQAEPGSTTTDYEPYQCDIYNITFPSEVGTVYGGTLDMINGVLTVDRAQISSYAGETLPGTWISDRDVYAAGATPTIGAQVIYELATPITYQLTPPAITLLRGNNNIWADCGNITIKYWQDKVLYENFYSKTQINNLLLPLNEIPALDNRVDTLENDLKATVKEEANQLINTNLKLTLPYQIANLLTEEQEYKIRLLDINYPIGSIYMSLNNADPKDILGGKWVSISQGRVLLGAGDNISDGTTTKSFEIGSTGGEYEHVLTVKEMPPHNHQVYFISAKGSTPKVPSLTMSTNTKKTSKTSPILSAGENKAHNNIQPYLVCNIWQRVIEDIHDVMRAMDSGTYTHLFNAGNEVPLITNNKTTIIMIIDQIDEENNHVYFRQKYTEGMEPCSNSEINDKLTSFQNSIPSDVKLALVGNPTLPTETTLDGVEVWATSNQGDTEAQRYLLPRICLKAIDMGISSNIVDAENSGHSF